MATALCYNGKALYKSFYHYFKNITDIMLYFGDFYTKKSQKVTGTFCFQAMDPVTPISAAQYPLQCGLKQDVAS